MEEEQVVQTELSWAFKASEWVDGWVGGRAGGSNELHLPPYLDGEHAHHLLLLLVHHGQMPDVLGEHFLHARGDAVGFLGWVGGWVGEKMEEDEVVQMSCWTWVGWVGGWVGEGTYTYVSVVLATTMLLPRVQTSPILVSLERRPNKAILQT